eukprot:scaffold37569_cov45-Phaeocystis_antarctica.AAC.3
MDTYAHPPTFLDAVWRGAWRGCIYGEAPRLRRVRRAVEVVDVGEAPRQRDEGPVREERGEDLEAMEGPGGDGGRGVRWHDSERGRVEGREKAREGEGARGR